MDSVIDPQFYYVAVLKDIVTLDHLTVKHGAPPNPSGPNDDHLARVLPENTKGSIMLDKSLFRLGS